MATPTTQLANPPLPLDLYARARLVSLVRVLSLSQPGTRAELPNVDFEPRFAGAARRVRCSAERPACAACIRHARWSGKDPRTNHGCSYKPSIEDEEEIETEEGRQLRAAKSRISELEARIGTSAWCRHVDLIFCTLTHTCSSNFS